MSRFKRFGLNLLLCLVIAFTYLGCYLMKMRSVLELKVQSPKLENLVRFIKEDNQRLELEKASFEDPKRLMKLKDDPEYRAIIENYNKSASAYNAASNLWIDKIIDPAKTREAISKSLEVSCTRDINKSYSNGVMQT